MQLWDTILDAQATLAGLPSDRPRPERIVLDRQISAGWMHSGYPIMAHLESTQELVDQAFIEQSGVWGPFHELGHNHQWREFVLPGTTEANVNLWSVHTSETVLGIDRALAHPALAPAERAQRITDYLALQCGLLVDRDLGPFFTAWGFPLSQAVIDQLALLPAWPENPMP